MRIFICGACALLLLFFSNDFGLIDIQETAIVIAIAIDKGEECIILSNYLEENGRIMKFY